MGDNLLSSVPLRPFLQSATPPSSVSSCLLTLRGVRVRTSVSPPPPGMKSVHRGIQDSSKINQKKNTFMTFLKRTEAADWLGTENCLLHPERTQPLGTWRTPAGVGGKCQKARRGCWRARCGGGCTRCRMNVLTPVLPPLPP